MEFVGDRWTDTLETHPTPKLRQCVQIRRGTVFEHRSTQRTSLQKRNGHEPSREALAAFAYGQIGDCGGLRTMAARGCSHLTRADEVIE